MSGNPHGPPIGPPPSAHYPPPPIAPTATNGLNYGAPPNYASPHKQEAPPTGHVNTPIPPTGMYAPPSMPPPPMGPPPSSSGPYPQSFVSNTGLNVLLPPAHPSGPALAAYAPPVGSAPSPGRMGSLSSSMRPPALDTNVNDGYAGNLYPQAQHQMKTSRSTNAFTSKTSPSNLALAHPESSGSLRRNQSSGEFSQGSGSKKTSRIDPAQMPRPDRATSDVVYHTRSGSGRRNPPSCNTIYRGIDTGNCLPRHMRVTMVAAPVSAQVLQQTCLPYAMLATPFAAPENGESEVPVVNMSAFDPTPEGEAQSPPRCSRCRGYINVNVVFTDGGNKWTCNLCSMSNVVPTWYYCPTDAHGLRNDRLNRPELQLGSVEFVVGKDYCVRTPQEPVYVFALDISDRAVANGSTMASLRAIHDVVYHLKAQDAAAAAKQAAQLAPKPNVSPSAVSSSSSTAASAPGPLTKATSYLTGMFRSNSGNNSAIASVMANPPASVTAAQIVEKPTYRELRIGIVTFNSSIQFYSVNNREHSPDPIRISVCDASDPFAILPTHGWLYGVNSQFHFIEKLLQRLPELIVSLQDTPVDANGFQRTPYNGIEEENLSCPTAAIKAIQSSLEKTGGRIFVLTNSHSTTGYGKIPRFRESINHYQNQHNEIMLYGAPGVISTLNNRSSSSFSLPLPTGSAPKPTVQQTQQEEMKNLCELYTTLGTDCSRSVCSVNLYAIIGESLNTCAYFDGALMSEPCTRSGGRYFMMPGNMAAPECISRLSLQLLSDITNGAGTEAVVKLRTSVGVKVDDYYGQGLRAEMGDEVEFASVDRGTSVMFTLKNDTTLKDEEKVHLQLATLYTNSMRQRVVRLHNITLIASNKLSIIYRNSDIETVVVALMKQCLHNALSIPIVDEVKGSRPFMQNKLIDILFNYRRNCSAASPRGQLILPESLKVLPIYTLSMMKHTALVENKIGPNGGGSASGAATPNSTSTPRLIQVGSEHSLSNVGGLTGLIRVVSVRGFERSYELRKLMNIPTTDVINSLYPRMYSMLTMIAAADSLKDNQLLRAPSYDSIDYPFVEATANANVDRMRQLMRQGGTPTNSTGQDACVVDKEHLKLQTTLYPSSEQFEADQIYLLDDKTTIWIYVGRNVPQSLIPDIFSVSEDNPYERPESCGFNLETDIGKKFNSFVELLRSLCIYKQDLRIIWADLRSDNPMITKFSSRLVEDSLYGNSSYVDYLCNVHTKIQSRLTA